jgi:L-ascorbate metabolism protein UlaG (beta-lactamase superfamily)
MIRPALKDQALIEQVKQTDTGDGLALWWLGQSGFLLKQGGCYLLFDPYLSDSLTRKYEGTDKPHVRMTENPVEPGELDFVDVVTSTHNHTDHLDADTLKPLLEANPDVAIIVGEANRQFAAERLEVSTERLVGLTDQEAKTVGGFEIIGAAAAHETVDRDEQGRPKFMGFIARRGGWTVYHSGDTMWFDDLPKVVQPFAPDIALLPINGKRPERRVAGNLFGDEAAELAARINAGLAIPCHYDMFTFNTEPPDAFQAGCEQRNQPYRVLRCAERLQYPDDVRAS